MAINVYCIDDEEALCENFADYFSSQYVTVTTFTDPLIAIETIKRIQPDLLFVDYRLPGTNGDEVAQAVAANIPKFLITGDSTVKTKYVFNGIFFKPYRTEDVQRVIDGFLISKSA